ncbi:hypothetical protein CK203_020615 [Vitis vinifera]|uniref:Retrovirus-related Pol polyprotein from transposon TNT 1-94 n=1 Tax=Vitis vinifera TaxID=29760 RepID=A0A438FMG9_VITVI|nr:hypothetical protein CK203_020615 [Vitis vinifera]
MMILLGCMDIDLALRMPKPDELNEQSTQEDEVYWGKWERSNRLSLMIMKRGIPEAFRGAAETSTLLASLISMKYKGKGNVREYIMEMSHLASKLKALKLELSDDLLVHLVLISLPAQFNQFKEERLKQDKTESAHLASTSKDKGKRKNKDNKVAASNERSGGFKFYDPAIRSIFETRTATFFEDVEFGGRNQARNIVFEEEEGSTIAFDNVQVSLPIIDQEVNLDPQPIDNIVQPLIANEDIAPEEQTQQPQENMPLRRSTRERRNAISDDYIVYL